VIFKRPAEPLSVSESASVPVLPVDSSTDSDDVTTWLEGVTGKVKAEEDAFEAERVFRITEEIRAEQGGQERVDAFLEHEAVSNQEKASGHRLTKKELDQMIAKEEEDRLRAEEDEMHRKRAKEEEQRRAHEEAELCRIGEEKRNHKEEKRAQKAAAAELRRVRNKNKNKVALVEASTGPVTSLFTSHPLFGGSGLGN